ncbi:hypothetical protein N825_34190 [Skermanella stibiiresistens SB22]|uniref:Uncharacterized protein n=1 Tax=Skermanella stibiiresistens SB22 TaxID=1385369 RepID=W9GWE8_9PROT|nr:hypothetical protein N825_34190 [Skermanella stibiiresistens SB22]
MLVLQRSSVDMLTDERIEELHEIGISDAEATGGNIYATLPERDLSDEEAKVYDYAFRNAFARMNGI